MDNIEKKILISEEKIEAGKALEWGLVDNILKEENFEENCIEEALKYNKKFYGWK